MQGAYTAIHGWNTWLPENLRARISALREGWGARMEASLMERTTDAKASKKGSTCGFQEL